MPPRLRGMLEYAKLVEIIPSLLIQTDPPGIAVFTANGGIVGLEVHRTSGGRWEMVDPRTFMLNLVT
ncbi:MAG: hypothetical protein M3P94_00060, partial [Chloroflexota bacterium]|nr:hypothetical protein [Chloroflexota bacterium]